jgi:hypothetical protein
VIRLTSDSGGAKSAKRLIFLMESASLQRRVNKIDVRFVVKGGAASRRRKPDGAAYGRADCWVKGHSQGRGRMELSRRLPPPWSVETDACFVVRDAHGQALAYVYFEGEPGRQPARLIDRLNAYNATSSDKMGIEMPKGRGRYLLSLNTKLHELIRQKWEYDIRGIKELAGTTMATSDPKALLHRLLQEPHEGAWLEFKHNNCDPGLIGRTISACANAAMLADRDRAFIVWGIENKTKQKHGTTVKLNNLKKGGENLLNWLSRKIDPRLMMEPLDFVDDGKHFAILTIEPTYDRPVKFDGHEFIRIGENIKSLEEFPEHERALWLATGRRKFEDAVAISHQSSDEILQRLNGETYYRLKGEEAPKNPKEIIRRFAQLGCIRDDMEGGYDILNLGALLFANDIELFPSIAEPMRSAPPGAHQGSGPRSKMRPFRHQRGTGTERASRADSGEGHGILIHSLSSRFATASPL